MNKFYFFSILTFIVVFILVLAIGSWFYELVINSSLPDWLKYLILR